MTHIPTYRSAYGYIRSGATGLRLHADVLQQSLRINAYCASGVHVLARTIIEAPAADDQSELEKLLELALTEDRPLDLLIAAAAPVLSRDAVVLQRIKASLAAAGVTLVLLDEVRAQSRPFMSAQIL